MSEDARAKRAAYMREYMRNNPEQRKKAAERKKLLRISNPELVRSLERASKEKHKEKVLARKAEYRARKAVKIKAYNAQYSKNNIEKCREWRRQWETHNRHVVIAAKARRRAAERNQTPKWANLDEIREIYRECFIKTQMTGVLHHVDHIVPLRGKLVNGMHVPWNLQVIPATENYRKSNKAA